MSQCIRCKNINTDDKKLKITTKTITLKRQTNKTYLTYLISDKRHKHILST